MGLREWVIVLALLFMVVLAADAWRRVRRQKRFQGRFTQPKGRTPGSKVEKRRAAVSARRVNARPDPVVPPKSAARTTSDDDVPMLVESVETPEPHAPEPRSEATQEQYEFDLPDAGPAAEQPRDFEVPLRDDEPETRRDESATEAEEPDHTPEAPEAELPDDLYSEPTAFEQEMDARGPGSIATDPDPEPEEEDVDDPALAAAEQRRLADGEAAEQLQAEPDAVLVLSVITDDAPFEGSTLLQILLACGMRFGDMNIFHATDDQGRLQYSAANAFNPGTFDLDDIEQFSTRGVTFFLQLPCRANPMDAFEAMVQAATTLSTYLGGELLDESRSVMTSQTLTHYRERIRDYQRSQLVNRA